jgi:glutathione synthase/RimK-type ligase-like ATP-grasp enzyme
MRIALVSCSNLPTWEIDDLPLQAALRARGAEVLVPSWDDPAFAWERVDAAVLRTTWDYVPRYPEFVRFVEAVAQRTRLFNPPALVRWNLDKRYLRELEAAGAPLAPTAWIGPHEAADVARRLGEGAPRIAFLKPAVGASASGTLRFATDAAGIAAAERHAAEHPCPAGYLLQPYLAKVETEGERSLIYFAGEFSHAVRKVPRAGDYRVQDDYGASDFPHVPTAAEREAAARALAALPTKTPPLYARVDLLSDDAGRPVLAEVELVEPSLFFRHDASAPERFARAVLAAARG